MLIILYSLAAVLVLLFSPIDFADQLQSQYNARSSSWEISRRGRLSWGCGLTFPIFLLRYTKLQMLIMLYPLAAVLVLLFSPISFADQLQSQYNARSSLNYIARSSSSFFLVSSVGCSRAGQRLYERYRCNSFRCLHRWKLCFFRDSVNFPDFYFSWLFF